MGTSLVHGQNSLLASRSLLVGLINIVYILEDLASVFEGGVFFSFLVNFLENSP